MYLLGMEQEFGSAQVLILASRVFVPHFRCVVAWGAQTAFVQVDLKIVIWWGFVDNWVCRGITALLFELF